MITYKDITSAQEHLVEIWGRRWNEGYRGRL